MIQIQINPYLILWYFSFLTNRVQLVKVNDTLSSPKTTNVGVPQGCISSPVLFTLYTSNCTDSTLLTLSTQFDAPTLYQGNVDWLVEWCDGNALIFNTVMTEEIIFGNPPNCQLPPVKIHNSVIGEVPVYKYPGVMTDENLSWTSHIEFICKKIQQRVYLLRRLRSFGASSKIIFVFHISNADYHALL